MKKLIVIVALLIVLSGIFVFMYRRAFAPTPSSLPVGVTVEEVSELQEETQPHGEDTAGDTSTTLPTIETVATNLSVPWDIVFINENDLIISERSGNLVRIKDGTTSYIYTSDVYDRGEGGLLGMVLHPRFDINSFIYLYATSLENGENTNTVSRYTLRDTKLTEKITLIEGIPGAIYHDGGRMAFGPDGKLYITTGDATNPLLAQDVDSLAGKILRINDDGSFPRDNPYGNAVWSLGHRNPQGLAWDEEGNLWSIEHGPSGSAPESGQDEINLIVKGGNYGWPTITGDEVREGLIAPARHSGMRETWAPASALWYDGSLFFGGLRGEALYEAVIKEGDVVTLTAHFKSEYGRIRTVSLGLDGYFYITTSNTDGRGAPSDGDDRVIKIHPSVFR